jgi:hypothetical protein
MGVTVDEVDTDVTVESSAPGAPEQGAASFEADLERLRRARAALRRDELRLRAEGFDD